jgi:hypothetical protein
MEKEHLEVLISLWKEGKYNKIKIINKYKYKI